jgi:NAD(P)-dependent dehydrogenase (short-subunit alcohol dehydrogenase family)
MMIGHYDQERDHVVKEFEGKVCIVTGGSRGIGRAIVELMAFEGADVHTIDIIPFEENPSQETSVNISSHVCDISDPGSVENLFQSSLIGTHIDILVNNAATVTRAVKITELSFDEWQKALSVNITGTFNVCKNTIPLMGTDGRIINLASTFAHVGTPGRVAYSTTKGAILAFTRSLALDLADEGIRVNSISPGAIATERLVELFDSEQAAEDFLAPMHPLGKIGQPNNIADAVWFLASGKSCFMTGADILVDGGYCAK